MGYNGYNKPLTEPLSSYDVCKILGENTLDIGSLCTSGSINKWSLRKPIAVATVRELTDQQWYDNNFGYIILSYSNSTDLNEAISGGDVAEWNYNKPVEHFRLNDFTGYAHTNDKKRFTLSFGQDSAKKGTYIEVMFNNQFSITEIIKWATFSNGKTFGVYFPALRAFYALYGSDGKLLDDSLGEAKYDNGIMVQTGLINEFVEGSKYYGYLMAIDKSGITYKGWHEVAAIDNNFNCYPFPFGDGTENYFTVAKELGVWDYFNLSADAGTCEVSAEETIGNYKVSNFNFALKVSNTSTSTMNVQIDLVASGYSSSTSSQVMDITIGSTGTASLASGGGATLTASSKATEFWVNAAKDESGSIAVTAVITITWQGMTFNKEQTVYLTF